ncbi:MAG TPA: O-antigen ligase family protein [Pyrinomonadaceae bacterium]|nr:O-antigen ligase family protein [Pyrinomonadaceae bacterium]
MLDRSASTRFSPSYLWILAVWFSLLLIPLLKLVPAPATVTGQPWKTEFAASIITIAALLWIAVKKLNFTIDPKILFPLFLFTAWSGISAFWADAAYSTAHHTLAWSIYLLFFIGASELVKNFSLLNVALGGLAVVVWILSVSCLFGYLEILQNPLAEGVFRVTYSKYGEILIAVIPLFLAVALYAKTRLALFCGATAVAGWAAVVATLSRTSFLAGAFGLTVLIVFLFFAFRPKRFYRRGAALAAILLVVTFLPQLFSLFGDAQNTSLYGRFTADSIYQQSSSNNRKLLWSVSFSMIEKNPLAGVGADNFGTVLNKYRAEYAARNPADANLAVEDLLLERAHNEFLQMFAELGFIGILLFAAFLFVGGKSFFTSLRRERIGARTILKIGAFAGILSFLASSVASSFSFRVMQNGFVFFFLLAILLSKKGSLKASAEKAAPKILRPLAVSLGFFAAICLCLLTSSQAVSNYYVWQAEKTEEFIEAENFYRQAIGYNPRNASAYYSYGLRFYFDKQPEKAVPLLEKAVDNGLDVSFVYSYLASAQTAARDFQAAEETLSKALKIYPRSTFLRVRYASLLEKKGETGKAAEQMEIARRIDDRQANGWQELITTGAKASALKARHDRTITSPADLYPTGGLYAVFDVQAIENLFPRNDFR